MKSLLQLVFLILLFSCSSSDDTTDKKDEPSTIFVPTPGTTFEWRLDDLPDDYTTEAEVVDIDAFSASATLVSNLQAQGKKVIAYISVGSVENFRDDANQFPASVIGSVYEGFEDENWLDIRNIDAIAPVLRARLGMIKEKGFDGVEPDNINGYQNNTGFPLTEEDAMIFSRWLIAEAHDRGLSIGQKNAEELVIDLVDEFDWMLTEDAYVEDFYDQVKPYIDNNKAVFFTEYTDRISEADFSSQVCPVATSNQFSAVLKNRDLTNTTVYCN